MNKWIFGDAQDTLETYSDGTITPHRYQDIYLDGVKVGYAEIHMHKNHGPDGILDTSFGFTGVVYGK